MSAKDLSMGAPPYPIADLLQIAPGNDATVEAARHLLLVDLFARHLLYLPLAYYFDQLRAPGGRAPDGDLGRRVVATLERTMGASAPAIPFSFLETAWLLVEHLVKREPNSPFVSQLRRFFQQFRRRRGARSMFHDDVVQVLRVEYERLAFAQDLSSGEVLQMCVAWHDHVRHWLDDPLFRSITLRAASEGNREISLHYENGSDVVRFSAEPFFSLSSDEVCVTLAVLWENDDRGRSGRRALYNEFSLKPAGALAFTPPTAKAADPIAFPWLRVRCERRICVRRAIVGKPVPVEIEIDNPAAVPLQVRAFRETFPTGTRGADDPSQKETSVPEMVVPPFATVRHQYFLVADRDIECPTKFPTVTIFMRQGEMSGDVAVGGRQTIQTARALPPNLECARQVTREETGAAAPMSGGERVLVGEEITASLTLSNSGGVIKELSIEERISGSVEILQARTLLDGSGLPVHTVAVQEKDGSTNLKIDVPASLNNGRTLTLSYCFRVRQAGLVAIKSTSIHHPGRRTTSLALPAPFSFEAVDVGKPSLELTDMKVAVGRDSSAPLRLSVRMRRTHATVPLDGRLLVQQDGMETVAVPLSPGRSTTGEIEVEAVLTRDSGGQLTPFSLQVECRTAAGASTIPVFGPPARGRIWRSVTDLPGFQGRAALVREITHALREGPVFLEGETGTGKGRLLATLRRAGVFSEEVEVKFPRENLSLHWLLQSVIDQLCRTVVSRGSGGTAGSIDYKAVIRELTTDGDDSEMSALLIKRAYQPERDDEPFCHSIASFLGRYANYRCRLAERKGTGRRAFGLMLRFQNAMHLTERIAGRIGAIHELLRDGAIPIIMLFADTVCPQSLRQHCVSFAMTHWTNAEFDELCRQCFVYPALSPESVASLFGDTGGHPARSRALIDALQNDPLRFFALEGATAHLRPEVPRDAIPSTIEDSLRASFAEILVRQGIERDEHNTRWVVALINRLEAPVAVERCLAALAQAPQEWSEGVSSRELLSCLADEGWVGADEARNVFGPPAGRARQAFIFSFFSQEDLAAVWLSVLGNDDHGAMLPYFLGAGPPARRQHLDSVVAAAEAALNAADYQTAEAFFAAFAQVYEDLTDKVRARVAVKGSALAWALGDEQLKDVWHKRLGEIGRAQQRVLSAVERRQVRAQMALHAAAVEALHNEQPARALKILRPYLVDRTLARVLTRRATTVLRDYFYHQLLALEILFFAKQRGFRSLYRLLQDAYLDLPWPSRVQYLETLWRIAENPRAAERARSDNLRLGSLHTTELFEASDRQTLFNRTVELYETVKEPAPLWLARLQHQRWRAHWSDRNRATRPQDSGEALLEALKTAIKIFRSRSTLSLLAQALIDNARSLVDLANESLGEQRSQRREAYDAFKEAAHIYFSLHRERHGAKTLVEALRGKLDERRRAAIQDVDWALQKDLEKAYGVVGLSDKDRAFVLDALVEVAFLNRDYPKAEEYLLKAGPSWRGDRDLEYMVEKHCAEVALEQKDAAGLSDAYRHLHRCRALSSQILVQPSRLGARTRVRDLIVDRDREELLTVVRLAVVCRALNKNIEALENIGQAFDSIGRWLRGGRDGTGTALWPSLPPKATDAGGTIRALFEHCIGIWNAGTVPVSERNEFFRASILPTVEDGRLLATLASAHRAAVAATTPLERIDCLLLDTEVVIRGGGNPGTAFREACDLFASVDLEGESLVFYVVQMMVSILKISLRDGLSVDAILQGFGKTLRSSKYGRPAAAGLANALVDAMGPLSEAVRRRDDARRAYLQDFLTRALALIDEMQDDDLDTNALAALVRAALLLRSDQNRTLRWMNALVDQVIRLRDDVALTSSFSFLCMLIGRTRVVKPAPPASAEASAAKEGDTPTEVEVAAKHDSTILRREAIGLCRRLIEVALQQDSWVSGRVKASLLFNLVEKVLDNNPVRLYFAAGLALHRASPEINAVELNLVARTWLPSAYGLIALGRPSGDGARVGLVLTLMKLALEWPFHGQRFEISSDAVVIWNLVVALDFNRIAWTMVRATAQTMEASELHFIRTVTGMIHYCGHVWAAETARANIGRWSAFGRLEPIEIELIIELAEFLLERPFSSFQEAFLSLRSYTDTISGNLWRDQVFQRIAAGYGGHDTAFGPQDLTAYLGRMQGIGLHFVEQACGETLSVTIEQLLRDVNALMDNAPGEACVQAPLPEPSTVKIGSILEQYRRVVKEVATKFPSQATGGAWAEREPSFLEQALMPQHPLPTKSGHA
jgi:hypothetical protein